MTDDERTVTGAITTMATTAIDGLKQQPGMILVAIINALFFIMVYFGVTTASARRDEHLMKVIDTCLHRGS